VLNDHSAFERVTVTELDHYDFAPADIHFVEKLKSGEIKFDGLVKSQKRPRAKMNHIQLLEDI